MVQEVTQAKIFDFIDVKLDYDKAREKNGWMGNLNDNFSTIEDIIDSSGGLEISAAGFALNNLRVMTISNTGTAPHGMILVHKGLVVSMRDASFSLFRFICTTEDLTADVGDPPGSNVGPGGIDNSAFGTEPFSFGQDLFLTSKWVFYYIISGGLEFPVPPALVISGDPKRPHLGPGFEGYVFFRRLGAARWDGDNQTLIPCFNKDGTTFFRDNQVLSSVLPTQNFSEFDVSSRIPPTSTRGIFSAKAASQELEPTDTKVEVIHEFKVRRWEPNRLYQRGDMVMNTSETGLELPPPGQDPIFVAQDVPDGGGLSGSVEPIWTADTGSVITDNQVKWLVSQTFKHVVEIPDEVNNVFLTAISSGGGGSMFGGKFGAFDILAFDDGFEVTFAGGGGGAGASISEYPVDLASLGSGDKRIEIVIGGGGRGGLRGEVEEIIPEEGESGFHRVEVTQVSGDGGDGQSTDIRIINGPEDIVLRLSVANNAKGGIFSLPTKSTFFIHDFTPLVGGFPIFIFSDLDEALGGAGAEGYIFTQGPGFTPFPDILQLRPPTLAFLDETQKAGKDEAAGGSGGSGLLPGRGKGETGIDGSGGSGSPVPTNVEVEGIGSVGGPGYAKIRFFITGIKEPISKSAKTISSIFVGHPELLGRDDGGHETLLTQDRAHFIIDVSESELPEEDRSIVLRSADGEELVGFELSVRGFIESL